MLRIALPEQWVPHGKRDELRRQREHGRAIPRRDRRVDRRHDVARVVESTPRVPQALVGGVQPGRDGGAKQDLLGARRARSSAIAERCQREVVVRQRVRHVAHVGQGHRRGVEGRVDVFEPVVGVVLPVAGSAAFVADVDGVNAAGSQG